MVLLLLYVGGALFFSFLCSILEAAVLSAGIVTLEGRSARGERGAKLLLDIKRHRLDDAISSILILNTFAHTVGAVAAGYEADEVLGPSWAVAFPFILTVLILVFTEIIPKTLGATYWSRLIGFTAHTVRLLIWCLYPAVWLSSRITRLLASKEKPPVSRAEVAAMVNMATREGTLKAESSRVLSNVLTLHEIKVEDVMTPRTVITMLPAATTIGDFVADADSHVFSRLPIFEDTRDNVLGYVLQREVLAAAARGGDPATPLSKFLRKPIFIPEGQPADRALRRLTEGREHLALITDEYGGLSGLVTLEDLIETLLGIEILDESDKVADLRVEAARLRERRLETIKAWRSELGAKAPPSGS